MGINALRYNASVGIPWRPVTLLRSAPLQLPFRDSHVAVLRTLIVSGCTRPTPASRLILPTVSFVPIPAMESRRVGSWFRQEPAVYPRLPAAAGRHKADSRPAQNQFSLPLVGLGFRRYPRHILAFPETRFFEFLAPQGPINQFHQLGLDRPPGLLGRGLQGPTF